MRELGWTPVRVRDLPPSFGYSIFSGLLAISPSSQYRHFAPSFGKFGAESGADFPFGTIIAFAVYIYLFITEIRRARTSPAPPNLDIGTGKRIGRTGADVRTFHQSVDLARRSDTQ
jgi:hypothetical protein